MIRVTFGPTSIELIENLAEDAREAEVAMRAEAAILPKIRRLHWRLIKIDLDAKLTEQQARREQHGP